MKMLPRERVLLALQHKEADMVPVDFGATRSTGINAYAYEKLLKYIKLDKIVTIYDLKQFLAEIDDEILSIFQSDCIQLHRLSPSMGLKITEWKEMIMEDGDIYKVPYSYNPVELEDGSHVMLDDTGKIILKRPKTGLYFDDVNAPLQNSSSVEEIERFTYPFITDEETLYLRQKAKELYFSTDFAIVATTGVSIFEKGIKDFGYEVFLTSIYTDANIIHRYLEKLTEAYLIFLEKYLDTLAPYIQVIQFNDDLGMQSSTIIAPSLYRETFKPYHKIIFEFVKKKAPNIYILLHSCGSIFDLIPDFIEIGVDAINPVQINAAKMDPVSLKREFGSDITFWGGGCSTQTTLTFGSVQDVEKEVKRNIDIFSPGGGFVFSQVHNIQPNVLPENILAMYQTMVENRKYLQR